MAKPRSFSAPSTTTEIPHAAKMGTRTLGGTTFRRPSRWVGVESSSRLAAKYEAKKKTRRILANSTGSKENEPTSIHRRAPLMVVPTANGATNRASAASNVR